MARASTWLQIGRIGGDGGGSGRKRDLSKVPIVGAVAPLFHGQ